MLYRRVTLPPMKTSKSEMIFARADKKLVERLQRVAARVDRPSSQIVREAVKAELDRIEGKGMK
jgi:predicted transcriptional regulator